MTFAVGSIVRARGREWVVLPESDDQLLLLRPLGGLEEEVAGVVRSLETVEPARFDLPDSTKLGDHLSCRMLRDAVRLGFRSSAGPFRSFGQIAAEPRPYQLVPLLLALKLDPIRLLIADDVGIGKTIEACLVVRELLDRGEIHRFAVLCPPQLAEQWQKELYEKFHLQVELVLTSTATRLERSCRVGQSLFEVYPHVIVSTDFIKSDRRRDEFLRTCPELVVIDEAHTCAFEATARSGRHQRYQLVTGLASDPNRHMVLVTATPHSGKEGTFRSLLSFLDPDFKNLPDDLSGRENEKHRRRLAAHFVQRRRGDITHFLKTETPFPDRDDSEESYKLSSEYKKLFERVLEYTRETVTDPSGQAHRQRVRWWSALALLRSMGSSPAAAAETLRARAAPAESLTTEEADEIGRRTVLDLDDVDTTANLDMAPGGDAGEFSTDPEKNRRRLLELAREAEALKGDLDEKLQKTVKLIKKMLKDGYRPIVFCRFIPTANYLEAELSKRLPKKVTVEAVTGKIAPADREKRVAELAKAPQHVLVCTDCLSEGINLQDNFDAVLHYDLSWNPTRHEQREGRVDRFNQSSPKVRVITYYGLDNQIDGIVLDVLLRKHKNIRSSLGISVPVPVDTNQVVEAIFEGLLLRSKPGDKQLLMFEEFFKPKREDLHNRWDAESTREKRSRTMFAQETIKPEEVAQELSEIQTAIGSGVDLATFVKTALLTHRASVQGDARIRVDMKDSPRALRESMGCPDSFDAVFNLPTPEGATYLPRTHTYVSGLAAHVLDTALDPVSEGIARRCGVIRTKKVDRRTTLLLLRLRYHIITKQKGQERPLLAEECRLAAFAGSAEKPDWLTENQAEDLLTATPDSNINPDQARDFVEEVIQGFENLGPKLEALAKKRGEALLTSHRRVRQAAQQKGVRERIDPVLPPDILGIYVYLPAVER